MKVLDAESGLYRVPFADIKPAKEFDEFDFAFFNPRIIDQKNKELYGFSKEEIDTLKESIRTKGLMENLNVNFYDGEIGIIDGHRRHEAISQLIEENASCYDNHTNSWISAKDLYGNIVVRVFHNLKPAECFSRAFQSDNNKVVFGENAIIRFVDYCIGFNMPEKKIIEMCGKTISWLRYVTKLINKVNDDKLIKDALINGNINASAADSLMDIKDEEKRKTIFEAALEKAEKDYQEKLQKQDLAIKNTRRKIEIAKDKKQKAEDLGDTAEMEDADSLLKKHAETLVAKTREKSEISPKINNKNLDESIQEVEVDTDIDNSEENLDDDSLNMSSDDRESRTINKTSKSTPKSIKESWLTEIKDSVNRGHLTADGESIPPIINDCFADIIKTIFETKDKSYEDFINKWIPKFIDGGLQHDAGFKPSVNKSADQDDNEVGDL